MTGRPAWPSQGPRDRDELAAWTTAPLDDDELGDVPDLRGPHPSGWTELVDGAGVHLRRTEGPAGSTPVWFIHGLGGSSTDFSRLGAALSPTTTTYSLDLPGSGRSDPPPLGRYSPFADAEIAAATIGQVTAGSVHLVGNSYGGVVATIVAAEHPELVRTLTVISPAVPDLRMTRDRGADPRLGLLLVPGTAGLAYRRLRSIPPMNRARGMGELCFGQPQKISRSDYEAAAAEHLWRGSLPWVFSATVGTLRGLLTWYLYPGRRTFKFLAARVRVPTLVVWGTRDRLVDVRLSRRTAAAFAQASLLVLGGCGHVPQMEDPWTTARAMIAFWKRAAAEPQSADRRPADPQGARRSQTGAPRCTDLSAVATS